MSNYHEWGIKYQHTVTETGDSGVKDSLVGPGNSNPSDMRFFLNVSASSGNSPTMDLEIYGVIGGVDYLLGTMDQVTGNGATTKVVTAVPKTIKVKWVVGGTDPSFTFDLTAVRV